MRAVKQQRAEAPLSPDADANSHADPDAVSDSDSVVDGDQHGHSERDPDPDGLVYAEPNCHAYAVVVADPLRDADCIHHPDRILLRNVDSDALGYWHADVHGYPFDDPVSVLHWLRVPDALAIAVADAVSHSYGVSNEQCIPHAVSLRCSDTIHHFDPNDDRDK